jgi:hypothetical protein
MATVHLAYAENGPFPSKNNSNGECFMRPRAGAVFAQIDAAQQRS